MPHTRTKPTLPPVTERDILVGVLHALGAFGIDCERQNTGAMINPKGQYVHFGKPGNPDIAGQLPDGRRLGIECKRPGKRPTPEQLERIHRINASNGCAFWTDTIDGAVEVLQRLLEGWRVEVESNLDVVVISPDEPRES